MRNIHYLVGLEDHRNCKLEGSTVGGVKCSDKGLATNCEAMLQGSDRKSRFHNWQAYIEDITKASQPGDSTFCDIKGTSSSPILSEATNIGGTCSKVFYVANCAHDFDCMMKSLEAQCLIFDYCKK